MNSRTNSTSNEIARFRVIMRYDGNPFSGFQIQIRRKTVQECLQKALSQILGEPIIIIPSGRTDAGVHALAQVAHFRVTQKTALDRCLRSDILLKLNAVLPDEIVVDELKKVPRVFHSRATAQSKTYQYVILFAAHKNPFIEKLVWRIPKDIDIDLVLKAAPALLGRHDFSAFCASDSGDPKKYKTIHNVKIKTKNPFGSLARRSDRFLVIEVTGDGFLKQMVRHIAGGLVAVGRGQLTEGAWNKLLSGGKRIDHIPMAPAQGLYLKSVTYRGKKKR